jgi:hypothetical protein
VFGQRREFVFRVWAKKLHSICVFVCLNRAREIEFNLLNRYLIVPASRRFMFDHDGKRVPKARDEIVTTSNFVSAQCVNDN